MNGDFDCRKTVCLTLFLDLVCCVGNETSWSPRQSFGRHVKSIAFDGKFRDKPFAVYFLESLADRSERNKTNFFTCSHLDLKEKQSFKTLSPASCSWIGCICQCFRSSEQSSLPRRKMHISAGKILILNFEFWTKCCARTSTQGTITAFFSRPKPKGRTRFPYIVSLSAPIRTSQHWRVGMPAVRAGPLDLHVFHPAMLSMRFVL